MKLVRVTWLDSSGCDGWHFTGGKKYGVHVIESVGWLFGENEEQVHIVPHFSTADPDDLQVRGDLCIPRAAIRSIKEVEEPG